MDSESMSYTTATGVLLANLYKLEITDSKTYTCMEPTINKNPKSLDVMFIGKN